MKHCRIFVCWIFAALCLLSSGALAQVITEFAIGITPGAFPFFITTGPDGNLWFTEGAGKIGRITPDGAVTEFSAGITPGNLFGIAAGPDGNLWFTESSIDRIGRITTTGVVTEFSTGISAGAKPFGIVAGPDGNLWFTEFGLDRIGRITPTGSVTEFSAGITAGANPLGIAVGPDGNLWFTERGIGRIGRITPSGTVTEFSYFTTGGAPSGITAGPDGNLWFTEFDFLPFSPPVRIGKITTDGTVTEFSAAIATDTNGITAGPDGNLWFAETNADLIGRITPTGTLIAFSTSGGAGPTGITTGPDGNLWFTETNIHRIGRITTGAGGTEADLSVIKTAPATAPIGGTITYTMTVSNAGPDAAVNVALSDGPPLSGNTKFVSLTSPVGWTTTTPVIGTVGRVTATGPVLAAGAAASFTLVVQVSAWTAEWSGITSTSKVSSDTGDPDWTNNVAGTTTTVIGICRKACLPTRTTTTVVSSVNPSQPGQAIVFTASVAGNFATGTVQFMDGTTNLGPLVTLSGGGIAQVITSTLTPGTHSITAVYGGDDNNGASTSSVLFQKVGRHHKGKE